MLNHTAFTLAENCRELLKLLICWQISHYTFGKIHPHTLLS